MVGEDCAARILPTKFITSLVGSAWCSLRSHLAATNYFVKVFQLVCDGSFEELYMIWFSALRKYSWNYFKALKNCWTNLRREPTETLKKEWTKCLQERSLYRDRDFISDQPAVYLTKHFYFYFSHRVMLINKDYWQDQSYEKTSSVQVLFLFGHI